MTAIALIGDSWAVGPDVGQPNLGDSLTAIGIPNDKFSAVTTGDVLALIQNYIAAGGTGKEFSMVLISSGGHDMMQGIPAATTEANLVAIGQAVASLGLRTELIGFPQIVMNGDHVAFPDLSQDAAFYGQATAASTNMQVLPGEVGAIIQHMPDYASSYVGPDYENYAYSAFIPHYNQAGSDAFATQLVGIFTVLNP